MYAADTGTAFGQVVVCCNRSGDALEFLSCMMMISRTARPFFSYQRFHHAERHHQTEAAAPGLPLHPFQRIRWDYILLNDHTSGFQGVDVAVVHVL